MNTAKDVEPLLPERAERLVGFFDVLGFKTILREEGIERTLERIRRLNLDAVFSTDIPVVEVTTANGVRVLHKVTPSYIFSDSILFWQQREGGGSINAFFHGLCRFLAECAGAGLLLRGGIAWGDCCIDPANHVFVGQPLVDAHQTEEAQMWSGAALHRSILKRKDLVPLGMDNLDDFEPPIKAKCKDLPLSGWVLAWPDHAVPGLQEKLEQLRDAAPAGEPRAYVENTLNYYHRFRVRVVQ